MARRMMGALVGVTILAAMASCSTAPPTGTERQAARSVPALDAPPADPEGRRVLQLFDWLGITSRNPLGIEFNASRDVTPGCYSLGDEQIRFDVFTVNSEERAEWDRRAQDVPKNCDQSAVVRPTTYYYTTLPDDRVKNLMIVWKNVNNGEHAYVVVRNTPSQWQIFDNNRGPWVPGNHQFKNFWWTSNGRSVLIGVHNPRNEGRYTANHILFTFNSN
jgi:hypothetical protein